MDVRVWIVGKNGILAKAFQRQCHDHQVDYVVTSSQEVDITNMQELRYHFDTVKFTHVINCSGFTNVDKAETDLEQAYALNAQCVEHLATLSHRHGKHLIHFSTDYVFDGACASYSEKDATHPLSIYGKSKLEGEKKLLAAHPTACVVRTSWLFGLEGDHFVKKMVELLRSRTVVRVVSDQTGCPTYADDLAQAVLGSLNGSGVHHFANTGALSWYELATVIKRKLEERCVPLKCEALEAISTQEYGAIAPRPSCSVLATSTFQPPHWERGLNKVLDHVIAAS